MKQRLLILFLAILAFSGGLLVGGLFFGQKCPEEIGCELDENELFISDLETTPLHFFWESPRKDEKGNPVYIIDSTIISDPVTIFSDGVIYRGRNKVVLSESHRRRMSKLYVKISGRPKHLED
jgi:hypothetical protein